jgi:hypothetical protein
LNIFTGQGLTKQGGAAGLIIDALLGKVFQACVSNRSQEACDRVA